MNAARIIVLAVAVIAGGLAAYLAAGPNPTAPPPPPPPQVTIEMTDVLVARSDIGLGQQVSPGDMQWQPWPVAAANPTFIRKSERPDAIEQLAATIARSPFVAGDPIREDKLIKANGSGFMASRLPSGMRAVSTDISAESGAGGFILPNDHVDVILTKVEHRMDKSGVVSDVHTGETVLTNVVVLAIDQTIEEKNGQRTMVGKTATLELAPSQAETLAVSRQQGTLSLALRSMVDNSGASNPPSAPAPVPTAQNQETEGYRIVLYRGAARDSVSCDPDCR